MDRTSLGPVEEREGGELISDGQRVQSGSRVKLQGHGPGFAAIPLGYEAPHHRVE